MPDPAPSDPGSLPLGSISAPPISPDPAPPDQASVQPGDTTGAVGSPHPDHAPGLGTSPEARSPDQTSPAVEATPAPASSVDFDPSAHAAEPAAGAPGTANSPEPIPFDQKLAPVLDGLVPSASAEHPDQSSGPTLDTPAPATSLATAHLDHALPAASGKGLIEADSPDPGQPNQISVGAQDQPTAPVLPNEHAPAPGALEVDAHSGQSSGLTKDASSTPTSPEPTHSHPVSAQPGKSDFCCQPDGRRCTAG